ncbi:MAG: hypothetical protein FJ117_02265 [Deltaproteobacteria bacterium]|nr:hypothetical protein [Deltaproteobacteria bacterium]
MSAIKQFSDKPISAPQRGKRSSSRRSRFLEISAVTILLTLLTVMVFSFFIIKWNRETLYQERAKKGKIVLSHFVNNAILPLLGDDTLLLNMLVKGTKSMDGFEYALIVDSKNIVKAHTDPTKIGTAFNEPGNSQELAQNTNIRQVKYTLPSGTSVLNFSRPVTYMDKIVGTVHLGLSLDFINAMIKKENLSLVRKIIPWGLFALVMAIGAAFLLNKRLTRSLDRSLWAEADTGQGQSFQRGSFPGKTSDSFINTANMEGPPGVARNHVTVLFAGVKGFKAYGNTKGVEEVLNDLNEYFNLATNCIMEHGGYIDKFLGDAVVGVFGSSPLQTDHIEKAVRSAIAMVKVLQKASENGNQLLGQVGIGVSSGVVLSGHIDTPDLKEYTSIGESFKEAYLLNVMAGPGEIILSKEVYQTVKGFVAAEPLPPREIMQRTGPWENFRLRQTR